MTLAAALQRMFSVLPAASRRQVGPLLFLMLLNAGSEVSGVAGLMPFIAVASKPALIEQNAWLQGLYQALQFQDTRSFTVFLGVLFVFFLVSMNVLNACTYYYSCRFSFRVGSSLSQDLLARYLSRPYAWYLQRNTSDLANSVLGEIDTLVERMVLSAAELITMAMVAVFLVCGLLWLNPGVALSSTLLLGVLYALIYRFVRVRVQAAGKRRLQLNELRQRSVRDALNAMKESRAFSRAGQFLREFGDHAENYGHLSVRERLLSEVPKYATETLAVSAIGGVLILLVLRGATQDAIPLVGVYIMAVWRMVPALQTLYRNSVRIRYFTPVLEFLERELEGPPPARLEASQRLHFEQHLVLDNITFSYPDCAGAAVTGVSLQIQRGSVVALVGRTGSGKSTLADLMAGLLSPQSGRISLDDKPLHPEQRLDWLDNVGYVPQDIFLLDDTLARNIALGVPAQEIDRERVRQVMTIANLDSNFELDMLLGERGISLSGGQRQRVGIARALYNDPQFLIFDEATSALDNLTEREVMEAIQSLAGERTVLLIAHRLTTVERCDCIFLLEEGRILGQGTYAQLLESCPDFARLATITG